MVLSTLIFLLFSVSSPGLLDQINDSYIDSVSELPISFGSPDVVWQQQGDIRAWVDIVGFRHMAYINGAYYVPGRPADYAIVDSGVAIADLHSRALKNFDGVCYWCIKDSIVKRIEVLQQGNETVARLYVTFKWHECITTGGNTQCFNYVENGIFEDSELSPLEYDATKESVKINEINYNHSLYAEKLIYVNTSSLITRYNVTINNGSVLHRLQIGQIDYTVKNIPYANFSVFDSWAVNGSGINYQYTAAILDNINNSYSLHAYSPFGPVNNSTISVSSRSWSPSQAIASFTFLIIFVVGIAVLGINKMR